jgi:DNA-binding HxlR family transcriptional regulator
MATRAARGFGQYSGAARALERVGDRWALLIVRDLLVGARRYGDLKAGLPRIPTNILSDRLKELQEAGVIRRVPTVRGGYELTTFGRALEPVVVALERWGWTALGEPAEGEIVTADALAVALRAAFRSDAAAGAPPTEYVLHVGVASVGAGAVGDASIGAGSAGEVPGTLASAGEISVTAVVVNATLEVTPIGPGALPQPRRGDRPEVAFEASAELVLSAAEFRDLISGALEPGAVRLLAGEQDAVERFARMFRIDPVGPAPDATAGSSVAQASVA